MLRTGPIDIRSIVLSTLCVLAVAYTLYLARAILLPLVLAALLATMLRPFVSVLHERVRIPPAVGAGMVLAFLTALLVGGALWLTTPAVQWLEAMPDAMREAEAKLRPLKKPVEEVSEATKRVEEMTRMGAGGFSVKVESSSFSDLVFDRTRGFIVALTLVLALLYFLLASGDLFLRKLVQVIPKLTDKVRAVKIVHQIQHDIARYFLTITIINAMLGVATGVAMYLLGVPNAAVWGVMAAFLNFIPYLGAIVGVAVVSLVALVTFEEAGHIALVPLTYYGLTVFEANFVTPFVVGKRLTINSVVLVVGVIFWGWIWGIAGAILAVPILVAIKVVCDRVDRLAPIGTFMGR